MRELTALIIVLVCVAFTGGCTTQTSSQTPPPQATRVVTQVVTQVSYGPTEEVSIKATSFDPQELAIKTGTTVTWVNNDKMSRHVVHLPTEATAKELFNSGSLSPGDTFSYTFTKPGRYVYGDPQHGGGRSPFVNVTD
jgi:plastocyanin